MKHRRFLIFIFILIFDNDCFQQDKVMPWNPFLACFPTQRNQESQANKSEKTRNQESVVLSYLSRITMIYGFSFDIAEHEKNGGKSISLKTLNQMAGIKMDDLVNDQEKFIKKLRDGKFKIDINSINQISEELSLNPDDLKKISKNWKDFLRKHTDLFSLSLSLRKRCEKSENAITEFILKNTEINRSDPALKYLLLQKVKANVSKFKLIKLIFVLFMKSDKEGFNMLNSLKNTEGAVFAIFSAVIVSDIMRKISKLSLDFALSPDSGVMDVFFIKPAGFNDLLASVSNQKPWKGQQGLFSIGGVYKPITFSELNYAIKKELAVKFLDNKTQ